jgi:glutamine amidotransferase-like uncharacterized protein
MDRLGREWTTLLLTIVTVASISCRHRGDPPAPVVLFDGTGTSRGDVAAIESLLAENGLAYDTAGSWTLDGMSDAELAAHRLLIVPGGDFMVIGKKLKGTTAAKIRSAVQGGLGYLGICGGALMAADSPDYNGFNLTGGVRFGFYSDVNRGIHKNAVAIARPGEPPIDLYWEDGPTLSGWGDVVAKYPDGTPAIAEGTVGRGWAVLSGVHPEAPDSWRRGMTFATSTAVDRAYAASLISAALQHTVLPHF